MTRPTKKTEVHRRDTPNSMANSRISLCLMAAWILMRVAPLIILHNLPPPELAIQSSLNRWAPWLNLHPICTSTFSWPLRLLRISITNTCTTCTPFFRVQKILRSGSTVEFTSTRRKSLQETATVTLTALPQCSMWPGQFRCFPFLAYQWTSNICGLESCSKDFNKYELIRAR